MCASERKDEIRRLLRLGEAELVAQAGDHLVLCRDLDDLHRKFAEDVAEHLRISNAEGKSTALILPVGPTGQYPILADMLNRDSIPLEKVHLFFMDEYCGEDGNAVPPNHPLSFRGTAKKLFLERLNAELGLRESRVLFPDQNNIDQLEEMIEQAGGIDVCYGGIGIHGHIAFNEPEKGVAELGPRKVRLNDFTVTINAVRAHIGGNLACHPRQAYTLGMKQILSARQVRLYCRNGCEFDWANTVLRLALLGDVGDDYPVTHLRNHADYVIVTDRETLQAPSHLI